MNLLQKYLIEKEFAFSLEEADEIIACMKAEKERRSDINILADYGLGEDYAIFLI